MMTAEELGRLSVKHASWLTEGVRSWFTPKPPTPKPPTPKPPTPKPYVSEQPSYPYPVSKLPHVGEGYVQVDPRINPGIRSGLHFYPYPGARRPMDNYEYPKAGNEPDFLQPPVQPKFNYLNPPDIDTRTKISPRNYVEPIYANYPGGLNQAIQDSQRWQDEARLAKLHTWTPEGLSKEVPVYTGKYVGQRETPSTPRSPSSFTRESDTGGYFRPYEKYIAMNVPSYRGKRDAYESALGHELTHAVHYAGLDGPHPLSLPENNVFSPNFMDSKDQKYLGKPTEFAARISQARRDWLQHNPGKRISTVQEASNVLNDIAKLQTQKPIELVTLRSKYPTMTPKDKKDYPGLRNDLDFLDNLQGRIPKLVDAPTRAQLFKRKPIDNYIPETKQQIADLYKREGRDILHEDKITVEPRDLPYSLGFPLEKIMADPELKRKTILQILSSVVQNKPQSSATIA